MELQTVSESEEEYHSLSGHEPEDGDDDAESETLEPPVHPVPSMQGAFEESIVESTEPEDSKSPANADAHARRQRLLESKQYDDSWTARWKQRMTAQHHPLLKLIAQIVFGMHLLQQQQAKSDEEVVKILQTHVNEVDSFLERTSEDFDLAIGDIEERIRYLKLPMKHLDVFDVMLDDKKFRTQLLSGNDKIERIIDRTAKAMNGALLDVQKGIQANKELGKYLDSVYDQWPREKRAISEVFGAMRGNEQGWSKYLKDLQVKGNNLGNNLVQLGTVIGEMSKLAAAASRRNKSQSRSIASGSISAPSSPGLRSKFSNETAPPLPSAAKNLNKPLPREPDASGGAAQATIPKVLHPVPFPDRYERPRQSPKSPHPGTSKTGREDVSTRPKTAGAGTTHAASPLKPREARAANARNSTADLAEFLARSMPLSSNPPDPTPEEGQPAEAQLNLSNSQTEKPSMSSDAPRGEQDKTSRGSRSQSYGAVDVFKAQTKALEDIERQKPKSSAAQLPRRSASEQRSERKVLRKDATHSTGLARRFSRRTKDDPLTDNKPSDQKTEPRKDSAYSSGTDKRTSRSLSQSKPSTSADKKPPPYEPIKEEPRKEAKTSQPSAKHGIFPSTGDTAATASPPVNSNPAKSASGSGNADVSGSIQSSNTGSVSKEAGGGAGHRRGLSLRGLFSRRATSRSIIV